MEAAAAAVAPAAVAMVVPLLGASLTASSAIEGGEWACPVCSQAVEVSVLLNASPEVVESVRATLRAERDAREGGEEEQEACEARG